MCISKIFNTLMRISYDKDQDEKIERCLGLFLAPSKPYSMEIRYSILLPDFFYRPWWTQILDIYDKLVPKSF